MNKPVSIFSKIPPAPQNKIFQTVSSFNDSTNSKKMNLSIGTIFNEEEKLVELQSVKKAEKELFDENLNKEYPTLVGVPEYVSAIQDLFFPADSSVVTEGRILTCQTITGGASLYIAGAIMTRYLNKTKIHISKEYFESYNKLFKDLDIQFYPYLHKTEKKIDVEGILSYLNNIENQSAVLLQVSGHNPTGLDFTETEWDSIIKVLKEKKHIAIFDVAYLGYGSGNINEDLYPIHRAANSKVEFLVCYSSAKNFCNYSDDIGALLVVLNKKEPIIALRSNVILLCRSLFSFSSIYGARIIVRILTKPELRILWHEELEIIINRIRLVRESLIKELVHLKADVDTEFLKKQRGLFMYLDLNDQQVEHLAKSAGIFVCEGGRINLTAITLQKVNYLAEAIKDTIQKP